MIGIGAGRHRRPSARLPRHARHVRRPHAEVRQALRQAREVMIDGVAATRRRWAGAVPGDRAHLRGRAGRARGIQALPGTGVARDRFRLGLVPGSGSRALRARRRPPGDLWLEPFEQVPQPAWRSIAAGRGPRPHPAAPGRAHPHQNMNSSFSGAARRPGRTTSPRTHLAGRPAPLPPTSARRRWGPRAPDRAPPEAPGSPPPEVRASGSAAPPRPARRGAPPTGGRARRPGCLAGAQGGGRRSASVPRQRARRRPPSRAKPPARTSCSPGR